MILNYNEIVQELSDKNWKKINIILNINEDAIGYDKIEYIDHNDTAVFFWVRFGIIGDLIESLRNKYNSNVNLLSKRFNKYQIEIYPNGEVTEKQWWDLEKEKKDLLDGAEVFYQWVNECMMSMISEYEKDNDLVPNQYDDDGDLEYLSSWDSGLFTFYINEKEELKYKIANKIFKEHLNKFKPLEEVKKLYTAVLLEGYREHTGVIATEKKKSLEQIAVYEKKLSVARNLLVTEKIDAEDYNLMKTEYNEIISNLEKEVGNVEDDRASIEHLTTTGLENLFKLGEAFDGGTLSDSREIIGLIFPENFTFSENKIRTARVNEIINCIYLVNNRLRAKKMGQKMIFLFCPE